MAAMRRESMAVRVPEELAAEIRRRAAEEERTVSQVIMRALRNELQREKEKPAAVGMQAVPRMQG
jgi:predicted transcriptional regulator